MTVEDKIREYREAQQNTLESLRQAQAAVQELTSTFQRQQGALIALEDLNTEEPNEEEESE